MNYTFTIHDHHEIEWTSNNIIKSDIFIKQINILKTKSNNNEDFVLQNRSSQSEDPQQICLVMQNINNVNEYKQSPLFIINTSQTYSEDIININVPASRKWKFYITDLSGNKISLKNPLTVSLILNSLKINK